ncbi:hypothetical protein CJ030_MR8G007181 [Morella rubra]|uniref:Uncharacterized protein n=1 Tax=Morella rubra TaxID=262757 RepID=A0A6A1UYU5_9ROSI|nr:hypothetical protein CJ030_MR8G007181 [Morella rubra]
MSFSRRFCVEAKEFQVTVLGNGVVKLSEWSRKALSSIFLGRFGAVWMVNMASRLQVDIHKEFVVKYNEASRAFLAQRCSNKAGRYVAIAEFGGGRRKGVVMIPEGKEGSGWKDLATVFQEVVFHFGQLNSSRGGYSRVRKEFSFAEVAKRGLQGASSGGRGMVVQRAEEASGGLEAKAMMHDSAHAQLVSDAYFSKEQAFNAKSAGEKRVDVTFWRNKLVGIKAEIDALLELLGLNDGLGLGSSSPVVQSTLEWQEKPPTQALGKVDGLGLVLTKSVDLVLNQVVVPGLISSAGLETLGQPKVNFQSRAQSEGGGSDISRSASGLLRVEGGSVDSTAGAETWVTVQLALEAGPSSLPYGARGECSGAFPAPELSPTSDPTPADKFDSSPKASFSSDFHAMVSDGVADPSLVLFDKDTLVGLDGRVFEAPVGVQERGSGVGWLGWALR